MGFQRKSKTIRKMKTTYLWILVGGIVGLSFHLRWHSVQGVSLFSFAPHVISGFTYTLIGAAIGLSIGYLIKGKKK